MAEDNMLDFLFDDYEQEQYTQPLGDKMLKKMQDLAYEKHAEQTYGDYIYAYHLDKVAKEVREVIPPNHEYYYIYQIVATGHDLLEDTDVNTGTLRGKGFSEEVIQAIVAITKLKNETQGEYLTRCMTNPIAHTVKIADTLSNLTHSVRQKDLRRITKYTGQLRYLHFGNF